MINAEKFTVILINDYRVVDDFAGVVVDGFAGYSTFSVSSQKASVIEIFSRNVWPKEKLYPSEIKLSWNANSHL